MNKEFIFSHYNFNNKISYEKGIIIHNILKDDYIEKNSIELYKQNFSKESFNKWFQMITEDKNYNIIICFDDKKIVGFLCYMTINSDLILCEIQIIPNYRKKYKIFKKLLQKIPKLDNILKVKCTIKNNNKHSVECFESIGMNNTINLWYELDYKIFIENLKC